MITSSFVEVTHKTVYKSGVLSFLKNSASDINPPHLLEMVTFLSLVKMLHPNLVDRGQT